MGRVRLKYVEPVTAKGRTYHYFRYRGRRYSPALPDPTDPEFAAAYRARHIEALGHPPAGPAGASPTTTTLLWLVTQYQRSPEFKRLAPRTRADYAALLESICEDHGTKSYKGFTRARITQHIRDPRANTPRRADYAVTALSVVFGWGVKRDLVGVNPCKGVEKIHRPGEGYRAWTSDELQRFWAAADARERLVAALAFYLALRPQDVAALTWFQVDGGADVRTQKRGKVMRTDLHPTLVGVLAGWPRTAGPIIAKANGTAFDRAGVSQIIKRAVLRIGGLKGCTLHGLRTTALTMAADGGATDHQLMALSTHSDLSTLQRYTRDVKKEKLASAAVMVLPDIAGTENAKLDRKVPNPVEDGTEKPVKINKAP